MESDSGHEPGSEEIDVRQSWLRSMRAAALDAVLAIDAAGTIHACNPAAARIFGYASEQLIGRNIVSLLAFPGDKRSADARPTEEVPGTGAHPAMTGLRRDGSPFPMTIAFAELQLDERRLLAGFVRDLSADSAPQPPGAGLATVISTLAHELTQPLSAIVNYAQAARLFLERGDPGQVKAALSAIEKSQDQALRAGNIVQRIYDAIGRTRPARRRE